MQLIKKLILMFSDVLGLNLLFRWINKDRVRLLMYHGVSEHCLSYSNWTVVDSRQFRWQVEMVARDYSVVRLSDLFPGGGKRPSLPDNAAVITFDDGLENNYSAVWPVLTDLGLVATCFVLTGLSTDGHLIWADQLRLWLLAQPGDTIDLGDSGLGVYRLPADRVKRIQLADQIVERAKQLSGEKRKALMELIGRPGDGEPTEDVACYRLMSIDQISELANSEQFEIGLHSHSHPIMSSLSRAEQEQEIDQSIESLRSHSIPFVPLFAYPNGRAEDFNEDSIDILKSRGIRAGLTTVEGLYRPGSDPYRVQRIGIGADMNRWEFKARLSGLFYFLTSVAGK